MSERLSDELRRVGTLLSDCTVRDALSAAVEPSDLAHADQEAALFLAAADKLDAYDRLVNGGPCETCGGTQVVPRVFESALARLIAHTDRAVPTDLAICPDCKDGRRPGIIERLEAIERLGREGHGVKVAMATDLAAVIADLRRMVNP